MAKDHGSECPVPAGSENYGKHGSAWKPMVYVSGASLIVTTVISLSLIILHLRRYRAPKEQRQIIRIVFSVVVYSLVAFFDIFDYGIARYIDPIGNVYEAFGLCALFLLFIQFVRPDGTFDNDTFEALRAAEENETATSFHWPKVSWVFVFQAPIIALICTFIEEITEYFGTYCVNSLSPKYGHLWVEILTTVSIGACVISIWKFRSRMQKLMRVRRGTTKLAMFKGIVAIRFLQTWIFSILLQHNVIKPGSTFSYNDILWGLPSTLTCVEMVIFAAGFWYAFSSTEYSSNVHKEHPLPLWKAILDALNPVDLIMGIARVFPLCLHLKQTGEWSAYGATVKNSGIQGAVRKRFRKNNNQQAANYSSSGGYSELDNDMQTLNRPAASHQSQDFDRFPLTAQQMGSTVYQPPSASPPDETNPFLMSDANGGNRPRSASYGYSMVDAAGLGRPRASSQNSLMVESDLRYDPSRSPSPQGGYVGPREGI